MSEAEMHKCLGELDALKAKFDAIFSFFGDKRILFGADRARAREMLRDLKDTLERECRRVSGVRGQPRLNDTESAYYAPAVQEASANLSIKTNSIPDAMWLSEVYDGAFTIDYYADQLRSELPARSNEPDRPT